MNVNTNIKAALTINKEKLAMIGNIMAVIPKIKVELAITEPIKLPNAISEWPILAALTPNASSGKDVPMATKNKPTMIGGSKRSIDNMVAYFTTNCALKNNKSKEAENKRVVKNISHLFTFSLSSFVNFLPLFIIL